MITAELIIDEIIETEKKISEHLNAFISQQSIIEEFNFKLDETTINKSLSECLKIVGAIQSTTPNQIQLLSQYQSDLTLISHKLEHQIKNNHAQSTILKYIELLKTIQATSQDFIQKSQNYKLDFESFKLHLTAIACATVFYEVHYPKMQFTQDVMDTLSQKLPDDQDLESILNIPASRKTFYSDFIKELLKLDASHEVLNTQCELIFNIAKIITDLNKSEQTFIDNITALTELNANFTGPFLHYIDLLITIQDTSRHFIEKSQHLKLDPESLKAHLTALAEATIFYNANRPKIKFTKDELERIKNLLPKDLKLDSILVLAMKRNFFYYNVLTQLLALEPSYTVMQTECKSILDDIENAIRFVKEGDNGLEKEKIASAKVLLTSSQVIRHEKREECQEVKPSIEADPAPPSNVLPKSQAQPSSIPTLASILRTIQEICLLNFYIEGNVPPDPNVYYSNSSLPKFSQSSSSESSSSESTPSERSSSDLAMSDISDFSDETDIGDFIMILKQEKEEEEEEGAPRLNIAETVVKPATKLSLIQRTTELLWYYMGYDTSISSLQDESKNHTDVNKPERVSP
jgi:hypothetical protein